MIAFERPSAASPGRGDDELDGLLAGFFRSEMPEPWPACVALRSVKVPARPDDEPIYHIGWLGRGRFALAASVALFLVGQFLLPNPFSFGGKGRDSRSEIQGDTQANTAEIKVPLDRQAEAEAGMEIDGDIIRVNVPPSDR